MIVLGNRNQTRNWKEIWKGVFYFLCAASLFIWAMNSIRAFDAILFYGRGLGAGIYG